MVRPKKRLGQHFLTQKSIAEKIVTSLKDSSSPVLEIGPGKGILTEFLMQNNRSLKVVEIDDESVEYLITEYPELEKDIISGDFLKLDLSTIFEDKFSIIGNFPYNISSQILFRVLKYKDNVDEVIGMFQKEVATRIVSGSGKKTYGILSVLMQAFFDVEYLFTVEPGSFFPPPKVKSAVIKVTRNKDKYDIADEKFFFEIVKNAFNLRRKTLRNSLRKYLAPQIIELEIFDKRPEQLKIEEFEKICNLIKEHPNK